MKSRTFHPPDSPINSLLSFGNALLYTEIMKEMYKTMLNPLISFVHEPSDNRFSLPLDLADIFKPLIVDRTIFFMTNKNVLNENMFEFRENACYLNREGREQFIRYFNETINRTIDLNGRDVSYRFLLRHECNNLIKHINGEEIYKGFKMWW